MGRFHLHPQFWCQELLFQNPLCNSLLIYLGKVQITPTCKTCNGPGVPPAVLSYSQRCVSHALGIPSPLGTSFRKGKYVHHFTLPPSFLGQIPVLRAIIKDPLVWCEPNLVCQKGHGNSKIYKQPFKMSPTCSAYFLLETKKLCY